MTSTIELLQKEQKNSSMLCVGLDTEKKKLPSNLLHTSNGILDFNTAIIEATSPFCSAYKINFAFYEQYGEEAFSLIKNTLKAVPSTKLSIADAKRGDIGNTSGAYARAIFDDMGFDAVTVSPYMGYDSVAPFLEFENKIVFILALTSNSGSSDFQRMESNGKPLYRHVIEKALSWKSSAHIGFVVGATHPHELSAIREYTKDNCLLIPGIGTQGGNPKEVLAANGGKLAVVNVSRDILYASQEENFAEFAQEKARSYAELLRI